MAAKKKEKSGKAKKIIIIAAVVLVFAALIALTIYNKNDDNGLFWRNKTVMKTDHYKVDNGMLAVYFYEAANTTYQNYVNTFGESMMQYLGLSLSAPLKDQPFTMGGEDSEYETWYDYFLAEAKTNASQYLSLCEAAKAAGVTLTDEDRDSIDEQMDYFKNAAKNNGFSLDNYLRNVFGKPVDKGALKDALELETLARRYAADFADKIDVSEEKLEEVYESDPLTYENVSYLTYQFKVSDLVTEEETEDIPAEPDETEPADTDAAPDADAPDETEAPAETAGAADNDETKEDAAAEPAETEPADGEEAEKAAAAAIAEYGEELKAVGSEDEFKAYVKNYVENVLGEDAAAAEAAAVDTLVENVAYNESNEAVKWAFEAKAGDTYSVASEDGDTVTVYYLVKEHYRDDDSTRNVRHILFTVNSDDDDEKKAEVAASAKEVYDKWVEDGATLEDFEKLVPEYTGDPGSSENGGLYENVARGQMTAEFNDWIFDPARKEGDHDLIETTYGWHIMYFVGSGKPAWKTTIESNLRNDGLNAEIERAVEEYPVTVKEKAIRVDDFQR